MKKIYKLLVLFIIIIFIIAIFFNFNKLDNIIIFSISIFVKNIFPFLFPMFIISSILIDLNIPYFLGKIFKKPFSYLFKANNNSSFIFFMSILTGFPSSAKYTNDLIDRNLLSKNEAQKILTFTFFSNPLFVIGTVGVSFYKSITLGLYLYIAHVLGNIITGIILRNYKKDYNTLNNYRDINKFNLFNSLTKSIKESVEVLMNIFGTFTFFLIIINLFFDPNNIIEIFMSGILEMTCGLKYLSLSNISLNFKLYLSIFFISFGGLSIHFQMFNILNKKKIKYLPFFISRIIHSLGSIIILFILLQGDKLF